MESEDISSLTKEIAADCKADRGNDNNTNQTSQSATFLKSNNSILSPLQADQIIS